MANPIETMVRAAVDGIGHATHVARGKLAALIPGEDPGRARGRAAWDARVASARADADAFARGDRIAAQLADHLDKRASDGR